MTSASKKVIAIDVDNVLADTADLFCKKATAKWKTTIKKEMIKHAKIVGSFRAVPEHIFEIQEEVWADWRNLSLLEPDASPLVNKLRDSGNKIIIATSRSQTSIKYVHEWLQTHNIVFDEFRHFNYKESKSVLNADVLVDDDPIEIGDFVLKASYKRTGLLYDQPWNRSILEFEGMVRIKSLKEIFQI